MSQKASATAIGAFILGAIALLIVALLTFGSGRFLKDTDTFVLYFQGNAKGLNIGAPTSFRGVKIGRVSGVKLLFDKSTAEVYVSVIAEIDGDAFYEIESQSGADKTIDNTADKDDIRYLIDELGLRAKLAKLSLVTGQLYIELDFYPDSPVHLYGFDFPYEEFPTLPSTMEELQEVLQQLLKTVRALPVRELVDQLMSTVEGLNSIVTSKTFRDTPELLNQTLVNLRDLTGTLNEQVTPLTRSLLQTSDETGAAFADLRSMMRKEESEEVVRLAESLEIAASTANSLLKQSQGVVSSIDTHELQSLVQELSSAAVSIRVFVEYLDRHPEALLRGKRP